MQQHKRRTTNKTVKPQPATTVAKTVYRGRNWSAYKKALVARYDITIWVEAEPYQAWHYDGPRQHGAQFVFSDVAIECMGTLREV
jgi:hypothetical protein